MENKYPVVSIEDGMGESGLGGWGALTGAMAKGCQLVGDDLLSPTRPICAKALNEK